MKNILFIILLITLCTASFYAVRHVADNTWYKSFPRLEGKEPSDEIYSNGKSLDRLFFEQNRNWFNLSLAIIWPLIVSGLFLLINRKNP